MTNALQSLARDRGSTGAESTPVHVMGLPFRNRLGIAAGIDRTGSLTPLLCGSGAGLIEIGTITVPADLKIQSLAERQGPVIGVNIGSGAPGFSDEVFADYRACLAAALPYADYIVLNFSNEALSRTLGSEAARRIVSEARAGIDACACSDGRHIPLLAKVNAGDWPIVPAVAQALDGFVIVSDRVACVRAFRMALPFHAIVSLGGVETGRDVLERVRAGADLVQIHRAFADGGQACVERMLQDLAWSAADG